MSEDGEGYQRDAYANHVWIYCKFGMIYEPSSDIQR